MNKAEILLHWNGKKNPTKEEVRGMVLNETFSNISVAVEETENPEKTTDLSQA